MKRFLFDAAVGRPAAVGFGEEALVLAWTARGDNRVTVARAVDGRTVAGNTALPDEALDGPALAYGDGHVYLAWTAPDGAVTLRAARDDTPGAGLPGVSNTPQIFGDDPSGTRERNAPARRLAGGKSPFGPALAWGAGALYLAWVEADPARRLNVAVSTNALAGGRLRWRRLRLDAASEAAPALAFVDGALYLAWCRRDDHRLAVLPLSPALRPGRLVVLAQTSEFAPALVRAGERFHLFWAGPGLDMISGVALDRLEQQGSLDAPAASAPAACLYRGRIALAWAADDAEHHVAIASLPAAAETIRVGLAAPDSPVIAAGQYGQFVEYGSDLFLGLWADRLCDNGFSGLSQYQFAYEWAKDDWQRPWHPISDLAGARFERLRPSGLRVSLPGEGEAGVAQHGIALAAGERCRFRCHIGCTSAAGIVQVRLEIAGTVVAPHEVETDAGGRLVELPILAPAATRDATLEIAFAGPGEMVLRVASLMPEDAVGGWRRDAVAALRAARPGVIRFGGNALLAQCWDFRWEETVGPVERRPPMRPGGGLQPLGVGLDEILHLCQAAGAEPLICVRHTVGIDDPAASARMAAREVEYCNGGPETEGGRARAGNGRPEPYRVRYWQIGNEQIFYANGAGGPKGGDADAFLTIARAMRAADPSLELFSSHIDRNSVAAFLEETRGFLDYVCPHLYLADPQAAEAWLRIVIDAIRDTPLKVAVTEWNTTATSEGPRRRGLLSLDNGLRVARFHHLFHRYADRVLIGNRSNLCNAHGAGILQTRGRALYMTPAYWAEALLCGSAGGRPLPLSPERHDDALDLDATVVPDGTVALSVVNGQPVDLSTKIDLAAFGPPRSAEGWTIADRERALDLAVVNDFADPERIATRPLAVATTGAEAHAEFPALSHSLVLFRYG